MHTCWEPDYVAHRKKEVWKVEEHNALLRVEEPVKDLCEQEDKGGKDFHKEGGTKGKRLSEGRKEWQKERKEKQKEERT